MRIYYAHCTAIYGTPQEKRDIDMLEKVFGNTITNRATLEVINPGSGAIAEQVKHFKDYIARWTFVVPGPLNPKRDASAEVMTQIFKPLAQTCNLLVFRALPDGRIPAGVAKEIQWAVEAAVPVMELPSGTLSREMTVPQTRQYLKEIGQR